MGIHLKSVLAKGLMGATLAFALVGCGSKSEPQAATEEVVQETWPYAEAMEYMNKHLYARAIQSVTTAMEQTGETAEGLTIRGVAHAKLNHPADAFRDLIEVTKIDYSATSLFNLGNIVRAPSTPTSTPWRSTPTIRLSSSISFRRTCASTKSSKRMIISCKRFPIFPKTRLPIRMLACSRCSTTKPTKLSPRLARPSNTTHRIALPIRSYRKPS